MSARGNSLRLAAAVLLAAAVAAPPVRGGNPIVVHSESGPIGWLDRVVPFNTDGGPLGVLDNAEATRMVRDGFAAWSALPDSAFTVVDQGPILLGGVPADITIDNAGAVLFQRDGQSPVIYDHDGRLMDALGVGQFAGVSLGEFLTPDLRHFLERAILLDGRDIDADGPFQPIGWQGLVNHEEGHHLGLAHSVVNGQSFFFNDPILGLGPAPGSSVETMYPFLDLDTPHQSSPHRDDAAMLSVLYPVPGAAETTGAFTGRVLDRDGTSPLRGVNVTVRNLDDPYDDAFASITDSRAFFLNAPSPVTGRWMVERLTPGARYTIAINSIDRGGFSSPILSPLPGPDEFHNGAGESSSPDIDDPLAAVPITAEAGVLRDGLDIIINEPPTSRVVDDPDALAPPADSEVSGFPVPGDVDLRRIDIRFQDTDHDGSHDTLVARLDVVGPVGTQNSDLRFLMDFGEPQKIGRGFLSLADQTVEPGTRGIPTADVTLRATFEHGQVNFTGLPTLADRSRAITVPPGTTHLASVPSGALIAVDQATARAVLVGHTGFGAFSDLAWSSREGRLFGSLGFNGGGAIIEIDPHSGEARRLGVSGFDTVPALETAPDGTLYGVAGREPDPDYFLVRIDTETGAAIPIGGRLGAAFVESLVITPDGRAFGAAYEADRSAGDTAILVAIDLATGAAAPIGPIGTTAVVGLEDAGDGRTLIGSYGGIDASSGALLRIDTVTGAGSFVGFTGFAPVSGLTELPGTGRIEFVAAVPEILAAATPEQLAAADNFDGTFTVLGFANAALRQTLDRAPDTNDNGHPSIVQETVRLTFVPFASEPTHLASVPNGTLILVDEASARAVRVGNTGVGSFSDLALASDGTLYGSLGFAGNGAILRIDPETAQSVFVGFSGFPAVPALTFGPDGTLYGSGATTDVPDYFLIRIDPFTGSGTPVGGRMGVEFVDAITFGCDGVLYGVAWFRDRPQNDRSILVRIDVASGAATTIGPVGTEFVAGMSITGDCRLLGSLGGTDPRSGGLMAIDPVSGRGTFIGSTGFSPVSGLTRLP